MSTVTTDIAVPLCGARLGASFAVPANPTGVVVFAHGSGSSRHSPRNRAVAEVLHGAGMATLLLDLLTEDEEHQRANVFDVERLASRLVAAIEWVRHGTPFSDLPVGLFGASTGAAAALVAASQIGDGIAAVVSRGGRPDLAGESLRTVRAPTLLIVGGRDGEVLALNERAATRLTAATTQLLVIPGATHLFEEPGTLDAAAAAARDWFARWFAPLRQR